MIGARQIIAYQVWHRVDCYNGEDIHYDQSIVAEGIYEQEDSDATGAPIPYKSDLMVEAQKPVIDEEP